jgi:hypothetical protein
MRSDRDPFPNGDRLLDRVDNPEAGAAAGSFVARLRQSRVDPPLLGESTSTARSGGWGKQPH